MKKGKAAPVLDEHQEEIELFVKKQECAKLLSEFHTVVMKEIAYYLTLLDIQESLSLDILIQLFRAYHVERKLVKEVYITHS